MTEKKLRVRIRSNKVMRVVPCHAETVEILGEAVVVNRRCDRDQTQKKQRVGPWVAEWCGTLFTVHGFGRDEVIALMQDKIERVRELEDIKRMIRERKAGG